MNINGNAQEKGWMLTRGALHVVALFIVDNMYTQESK
jgi:hypothetical protein